MPKVVCLQEVQLYDAIISENHFFTSRKLVPVDQVIPLGRESSMKVRFLNRI